MIGLGATTLLWVLIRYTAKGDPATMTKEYQEATNEYLKVRHNSTDRRRLRRISNSNSCTLLILLNCRLKTANPSPVSHPKTTRVQVTSRASQVERRLNRFPVLSLVCSLLIRRRGRHKKFLILSSRHLLSSIGSGVIDIVYEGWLVMMRVTMIDGLRGGGLYKDYAYFLDSNWKAFSFVPPICADGETVSFNASTIYANEKSHQNIHLPHQETSMIS